MRGEDMVDLSGDLFEIEEQVYRDEQMLKDYAKRVLREYYILTEEEILSVNGTTSFKHTENEYIELCKRLIDKKVNLVSCFYRTKVFSVNSESMEDFVRNLMRLNREKKSNSSVASEDLEAFISIYGMYEHIDEKGRFRLVSNLKELDDFLVWTASNLEIEYMENEGYESYLMLLCLINDEQLYRFHKRNVFPRFAYRYFVKDLLRMERIDIVPLLLIFMWEDKDE